MGIPIDTGTAVAAYKQILREALEKRPAGIRRRLAEVMGKNRSFITHLSNPTYSTPIPARYVDSILAVCHFSLPEREAFLAAYEKAHPGKLARPAAHASLRTVSMRLPDLEDPDRNAQLERMLHDMAFRIAHLIQAAAQDAATTDPRPEGERR
jgi:hypothetical protein